MSVHPTASLGNVYRRINGYIAGLSLPGAPRVILAGDSVSLVGPGPTVRLTLTPFGGTRSGRYSSTAAAFESEMLLTADVFWPSGEDALTHGIFNLIDCADVLKEKLTRLSLAVLDYSSDPLNPSTVEGAWYRTKALPEVREAPVEGAFQRLQVTVPLFYHEAHADAA